MNSNAWVRVSGTKSERQSQPSGDVYQLRNDCSDVSSVKVHQIKRRNLDSCPATQSQVEAQSQLPPGSSAHEKNENNQKIINNQRWHRTKKYAQNYEHRNSDRRGKGSGTSRLSRGRSNASAIANGKLVTNTRASTSRHTISITPSTSHSDQYQSEFPSLSQGYNDNVNGAKKILQRPRGQAQAQIQLPSSERNYANPSWPHISTSSFTYPQVNNNRNTSGGIVAPEQPHILPGMCYAEANAKDKRMHNHTSRGMGAKKSFVTPITQLSEGNIDATTCNVQNKYGQGMEQGHNYGPQFAKEYNYGCANSCKNRDNSTNSRISYETMSDFPPLSASGTNLVSESTVTLNRIRQGIIHNRPKICVPVDINEASKGSQQIHPNPTFENVSSKGKKKNKKGSHPQPQALPNKQRQEALQSTNKSKQKRKQNAKTKVYPRDQKKSSAVKSIHKNAYVPGHEYAQMHGISSTYTQFNSIMNSNTNVHIDANSRTGQSMVDPHAAAFIHVNNMLPMGVTVKGKQKIGKRKKILTPLKKQILKERLARWQESQRQDQNQNENRILAQGQCESKIEILPDAEIANNDDGIIVTTSDGTSVATSIVYLQGYVHPDELHDDEEFEEIQNDLQVLSEKIGAISKIFIPRSGEAAEEDILAYVEFQSLQDAFAATACWNGMVLGGVQINVGVIPQSLITEYGQESDDGTWTEVVCLIPSSKLFQKRNRTNASEIHGNALFAGTDVLADGSDVSGTSILYLENILNEDDYEDEECLEASRDDIKTLVSKYGSVKSVDIQIEGDAKGEVNITYSDVSAARKAVSELDGMVLGGLVMKAWADESSNDVEASVPILLLRNILTEDDFEDEECLEETKSDIIDMLQKHGVIKSFDFVLEGSQKGDVSVVFVDSKLALIAANELHDKMVGGCKISATVLHPLNSKMLTDSSSPADPAPDVVGEAHEDAKEIVKPMYSGDKVIPEQYAECKRVPKIPNSGVPREYAKRIDDESVVPLLFDMLGELMRLQIRAKDSKNAKARRRLVMGLREVCRGIRARKVKMIVMANNLDQYGALDAKLQEILDLAKEHGLPVIFELNKRKIGKALGKTIKVSVVGIENADGAYEPFKKLKRLYELS